MHKKPTVLVAIAVLCVLFFGYLVRAVTAYTFHDDACFVIGMCVAGKIEKGDPVSDGDLRREIASLIRASVIHGRVDREGNPTDLNGNNFLIQQTGDRVIVCTKFSFLQLKKNHVEVEIKK